MLKKGSTVVFEGRVGKVVGFMPAGMVDVRFQDTDRVERRHEGRLAVAARHNPDDEEDGGRREQTTVSTKKHKELKEYKSAAIRHTKPKLGLGSGVDSAQRSDDQLGARGAVLFTQEDSPRFSTDKTAYCGNPIDGVAYYIIVSDQSRGLFSWLKASDVRAKAAATGRTPDWSFLREVLAPEAEGHLSEFRMPRHQGVRVKGGGNLHTDMLPEDLKKPARPSNSYPDPHTDFWLPDARTGEPVFFRTSRRESPGLVNLDRFQAFKPREYVVPPNVPEALVQQWGPLAAALAVASKGDISPSVAKDLIVSCAVHDARNVLTLGHAPAPGTTLTVRLQAKASSPFFSWVPAAIPIRDVKHLMACPSAEDQRLVSEMSRVRSVLSTFDSALSRCRTLFSGLSQDPRSYRTGASEGLVASLLASYSNVVRLSTDIASRAVVQNDPVAKKLLALMLDPDNSWFEANRLLTGFKSSAELLSLAVPDSGWVVVRNKSPKQLLTYSIARSMRVKQRQGFEVQMLDEQLGLWCFRPPPTKTQKAGAMLDLLAQQILRSGTLSVPPADLDGTNKKADAEENDLVRSPLAAPLVSAIRAFSGENVNPMASLFAIQMKATSAETQQKLAALLNAEPGSAFFRPAPEPRMGPVSPEEVTDMRRKLTESSPAREFAHAVGALGSGGLLVRTPAGIKACDPLDISQPAPPVVAWGPGVTTTDQENMNWVLHLVVNFVYPALSVSKGSGAEQACRNLLILGFLYLQMGGAVLASPLNGSRGGNALQKTIRMIREREVNILGGSDLKEQGQYRTFMTYNPVLFELTRLFWPDKREKTHSEAVDKNTHKITKFLWGDILRHRQELQQIDAVGVYGSTMHWSQVLSRSVAADLAADDVSEKLLSLLSVSASEPTVTLMRGWSTADGQRKKAPPSVAAYLCAWPLGRSREEIKPLLHNWVIEPVQHVAALKSRMAAAVGGVFIHRKTQAGDLPFLTPRSPLPPDHPAISPKSVLTAAEPNEDPTLRMLEKASRNPRRPARRPRPSRRR